jgi:DNA-binding HxlR family transcriptional regulator
MPHHVLAILRRKWACRVVLELERGPNRFGMLARAVPGLRRPVLALELGRLIQDGLVRKTEVSRKPLKVSYRLTRRGAALCRLLRSLDKWEARYLRAHRSGPATSGHYEMTGTREVTGQLTMTT